MEQSNWVFFLISGMILQYFFYIIIPSCLAVKIIKAISPSFLKNSQFLRRHWYDALLWIVMVIPLSLLLMGFGVDIILEIPTWAPWIPEQMHHMYHTIVFPIPIGTFIAKIVSVIYLSKRFQKN